MGMETSTPPASTPVSVSVPKLRPLPQNGALSPNRAAANGGAATGTLTAPVPVQPGPRPGPRPAAARGRAPRAEGRQAGSRLGRVYSKADQAPRLRQLMGVCGWAAVLGGIGLVLGLRGFVGILVGDAPSWYEPSTVAAGLIGIGLTVGAFLTVHRVRAPWVLLSCASVTLITAMVFTSVAF